MRATDIDGSDKSGQHCYGASAPGRMGPKTPITGVEAWRMRGRIFHGPWSCRVFAHSVSVSHSCSFVAPRGSRMLACLVESEPGRSRRKRDPSGSEQATSFSDSPRTGTDQPGITWMPLPQPTTPSPPSPGCTPCSLRACTPASHVFSCTLITHVRHPRMICPTQNTPAPARSSRTQEAPSLPAHIYCLVLLTDLVLHSTAICPSPDLRRRQSHHAPRCLVRPLDPASTAPNHRPSHNVR